MAGCRIKLVLLSSIFGGLALIVMAILLASIIGLVGRAAASRAALLRTIGATPRQVRRLVVRATHAARVCSPRSPGRRRRPVLRASALRPHPGRRRRARRPGAAPGRRMASPSGALARAADHPRRRAALAARKAGRARLGRGARRGRGAAGDARAGRRIAAAVCSPVRSPAASSRSSCHPRTRPRPAAGPRSPGALACALVAPRLIERLAAQLRFTAFPGQLAVLNVRARAHRNAALVTPVILVASIALANVYQQTTQADAVEHARGHDVRRRREHDHERRLGGAPRRPLAPHRPVAAARRRPASRNVEARPGNTVAIPDKIDAPVGDTIGMVLGDGAHVRLKVASPRRLEPQPLDPPADRAPEGPYERDAASPTRPRSTCGSRSPSSA